MCGTPDFSALGTSLTRITAITIAGSSTYAVYKIKNLLRQLKKRNILNKKSRVLQTGNETVKTKRFISETGRIE